MKLGITTRAIKEWSKEKGLSGADPDKQFRKLIEEAGELAEAINKDLSDEEKMMEAGDVFIVLTIMMQQYGFDIEDCVELAYKKIENREGAMVNGVFVKQSDL